MKLIALRITGFRNLTGPNGRFEMDCSLHRGVTALVGANGSGKSNVLEAISAIFANLHHPKKRFPYNYELVYVTGDTPGATFPLTFPVAFAGPATVRIVQQSHRKTLYVNGTRTPLKQLPQYLPKHIVANYSGDETRLRGLYGKDGYLYARDDRTLELRPQPMVYIDRSYWDIALLTLLSSELSDVQNFVTQQLGVTSVSAITIEEYKRSEVADKQAFAIMTLLGQGKHPGSYVLTLKEFKQRISDAGYSEREVFDYLARAKAARLLEKVDIRYENNQTIASMSEGQKKLLVAKFILEVLADEHTLVLLDEIDAHIHVGLKSAVHIIVTSYPNRHIVLTTHSPTLMHDFDEPSVVYLTKGEIKGEEKRAIVTEITDGNISYTDREIILTSKKPLLLLVEGKTDVEHIRLAASKLGIELAFDVLACGNNNQIASFIGGMPANLFEHSKYVIGVLDLDHNRQAARIVNIGVEIAEGVYTLRPDPNHYPNAYTFILPAPDPGMATYKYCPIEFLYPEAHLREKEFIVKRSLQELNAGQPDALIMNAADYAANNSLCVHKIDESQTSKVAFLESCRSLETAAFESFRPLFDKITAITGLAS